MTNKIETIQIRANVKNVAQPPILCNEMGNKPVTIKLNTKFDKIAILIALPRYLNGKTSATSNKPTGPNDIEKETIYKAQQITAKYLANIKSKQKVIAKIKRLISMPDKPIYKRGFLPILSTRTIATKVIRKLIKPIKIVANNTS